MPDLMIKWKVVEVTGEESGMTSVKCARVKIEYEG
jgi:hypothetical protein